MSVTTIHVPAELVDAIRASLLGTRRELEGELAETGGRGMSAPGPEDRLEELDALLAQINSLASLGSDMCRLTGSRGALWGAVYDVVCRTAERVAEDCNEYWRGEIDPLETRALIAGLGVRFELLRSLGPPPGDEGD